MKKQLKSTLAAVVAGGAVLGAVAMIPSVNTVETNTEYDNVTYEWGTKEGTDSNDNSLYDITAPIEYQTNVNALPYTEADMDIPSAIDLTEYKFVISDVEPNVEEDFQEIIDKFNEGKPPEDQLDFTGEEFKEYTDNFKFDLVIKDKQFMRELESDNPEDGYQNDGYYNAYENMFSFSITSENVTREQMSDETITAAMMMQIFLSMDGENWGIQLIQEDGTEDGTPAYVNPKLTSVKNPTTINFHAVYYVDEEGYIYSLENQGDNKSLDGAINPQSIIYDNNDPFDTVNEYYARVAVSDTSIVDNGTDEAIDESFADWDYDMHDPSTWRPILYAPTTDSLHLDGDDSDIVADNKQQVEGWTDMNGEYHEGVYANAVWDQQLWGSFVISFRPAINYEFSTWDGVYSNDKIYGTDFNYTTNFIINSMDFYTDDTYSEQAFVWQTEEDLELEAPAVNLLAQEEWTRPFEIKLVHQEYNEETGEYSTISSYSSNYEDIVSGKDLGPAGDYPDNGLSGGAIAGIVIGSVAGAALIGGGIWYYYDKKRKGTNA